MNNSKKINDKGFSLIELIVVIAIMVVLVAILSPVFTRFIEQGRRATDVTNANTLASAILIDIESGSYNNGAAAPTVKTELTDHNAQNTGEIDKFESIGSLPTVQGTGFTAYKYYYTYDSTAHTVTITIEGSAVDGRAVSVELTNPTTAKDYKDQKAPNYK